MQTKMWIKTQVKKIGRCQSGARRGTLRSYWLWWISSLLTIAVVSYPSAIRATTTGSQQTEVSPPKPSPLNSQPAPNESPSMNLIPVDQPVAASAATGVIRMKPADASSMLQGAQAVADQQHQDTANRATMGQAELQANMYHTTGGGSELSAPVDTISFGQPSEASGSEPTAPGTDELGGGELALTARHSAPSQTRAADGADAALPEPQSKQRAISATQQQLWADSALVDSYLSGALNQHEREHFQVGANNKHPPVQTQQIVERRFGLFKKHHYGAPMSASYSASPYMSDCERCLASLSQQSADLQQLEPIPAPPPPPVPVPVPVPVAPVLPANQPAQPAFNMQPFGPLKNKLFMKFPFFMKPMSFGDGSYGSHGDSVPYWHQYQPQPQLPPASRPQATGALYIRPAPTAYNCIQATPPLISASHQDQVGQFGKTSGQNKQYSHHQQTSYPSSQY